MKRLTYVISKNLRNLIKSHTIVTKYMNLHILICVLLNTGLKYYTLYSNKQKLYHTKSM